MSTNIFHFSRESYFYYDPYHIHIVTGGLRFINFENFYQLVLMIMRTKQLIKEKCKESIKKYPSIIQRVYIL